ncbi:PREDICTED: CUB domain-containing protein 1-like isoform X1 [Poecilia mexicana]|uniref:CUB domain-containing protein 1-like isoform X1 n=1 Tax=Poecilia mexicana TaxID=48701 RepID=UPI00072EA58A|nr:PREDICTED: CUB domain-containing protein 1-like isoform X1 [Poecilia mexicana]
MYFNKSEGTSLQILLFITAVSIVSGSLTLTAFPLDGSIINIINSKASSCKVCTSNNNQRQCYNSLTLVNRTYLEFNCTKPQDFFTVEIVHQIACNLELCGLINPYIGFSDFLPFDRKFIWKIEADSQKSFQIKFANTRLNQIAPGVSCANKHTYTLRAANVLLGKFCSSGTIRSATIQSQGSFSLHLPAGQEPSSDVFLVSAVERIPTFAKISVTLQKGLLSSTLLTPNYPDSFPNAELMEWYFHIPNNYKTAIKFSIPKNPTCLKDKTYVEFRNKVTSSKDVLLRGDQPVQKQGSFSLRLKNCHMDTQRPDGLSMSLTVTAFPESQRFTSVGVLAAVNIIILIVLLVFFIVTRKKKRDLHAEESIYNPDNTNLQTRPKKPSNDESLVYSHLLQKQDGV